MPRSAVRLLRAVLLAVPVVFLLSLAWGTQIASAEPDTPPDPSALVRSEVAATVNAALQRAHELVVVPAPTLNVEIPRMTPLTQAAVLAADPVADNSATADATADPVAPSEPEVSAQVVAPPAASQCNGTDNVGGQAVACDVEVVNNLDLATGETSSTTTVKECHGAANDPATLVCTTTVTPSDELVTAVDQCNGSGNGGGGTVKCNVKITNNITGAATPVPATVNQCNNAGQGGGTQPTTNCNPFPASTTNATVEQCNNSGNGGGGTQRVRCRVAPDSTNTSALPVTVDQCNGSGNGGGGDVECTVAITNNITTGPPGQTPPGQTPPGQTPPGQTPPGQTPPGQTPPVTPPVVFPPTPPRGSPNPPAPPQGMPGGGGVNPSVPTAPRAGTPVAGNGSTNVNGAAPVPGASGNNLVPAARTVGLTRDPAAVADPRVRTAAGAGRAGPGLARTGSDETLLLLIGVAMLLSGLALTTISRRRDIVS